MDGAGSTSPGTGAITRADLERHLPHRAPFLFIDRVLELQDGRARAAVTFRPEQPWFAGHFPGNPLVPGVLILEALAQTAGLAVPMTHTPDGDRAGVLAQIRDARFRAPARPGEEIALEAEVARIAAGGRVVLFKATARSGDRTLVEAELMLARP